MPAVTFADVISTVGFTFSGSGSITFAFDATEVPSESVSTAIRYSPAFSFPIPNVALWLFSSGVIAPE